MRALLIVSGVVALSAAANAGNFVGTWSFSLSDTVKTIGTGTSQTGTHNTNKFDTVRTGGTDLYLPLASNHFVTFCAELNQTISGGTGKTHDDVFKLDYSNSISTFTGGYLLTATKVTALQKMWGYLLATTTSPNIPGGPTGTEWFNPTTFSQKQYAGFQLAQWEIMFENGQNGAGANPFSLAGGNFKDNGTAADILGIANGFLTQANTYTGQLADVYLMRGGNIQDQITGALPPVPGGNTVPEPFTMGLGLAAAGAFVRRRFKTKAA